MALQPRATLTSDSTPNPLPSTGEIQDPLPEGAEQRTGRSTSANIGLALPQTSPDKALRFQPQ